ncbi:hypothetical protein Bhyg_16690, partial [Pseudolycoriella hygida]
SVTQLLSDSCNSLLQRFRRIPSEKPDKRSNTTRFSELSPCKETETNSESNNVMADKSKRSDTSSGYGSSTSSAFSRLRYNLSPVSSYYKPLMRTFGKRDDTPPKRKDIDRDKTPVVAVPKTSSTISRLESKYSDVLGRVARRRQEEDDREKTLEPERPYVNPISRSATTVMLGDKALASYQKERTPYKLARNRNKYDMESFKPRSELSLLQDNNRYKSKNEYDPIRRKDTLYDAYSRHGRYNNLNGSNLNHRTRPGLDYGYYDGGGKENAFKSKYDPDMIYSEVNNNYLDHFNGPAATKERDRKRAIRSYRRADTSHDRRHTTHLKELDDEPDIPSSSRFTNRKSYQRSQTQKFFDSENLLASNNNHLTDNGSIAETSVVPNEALTEREARRKEIQGLIMKYAQLDDVYNKTTEDQANNNMKKVDPFGLMPSTSSMAVPHSIGGGFIPLSKTQTVAAMSSTRSRIPKALST